jgi:hypothetical protein
MELAGRTVRFHVSPEGRKALRGLVPATGSFQAHVVEQGELGLLVNMQVGKAKALDQNVPVMLLRWDYIATMSFEYRPERGPIRAAIGFRMT